MEVIVILVAIVLAWFWFKSHGRSRDKDTLMPFRDWVEMYEKESSPVKRGLLASTLLFQALHVATNSPDAGPGLEGLQRNLYGMAVSEKSRLVDELLRHGQLMPRTWIAEIINSQARVAMGVILIDWSNKLESQ